MKENSRENAGLIERLKRRYRLIERYLNRIQSCLYAEYYGTAEEDSMKDLPESLRKIEELEGLLSLQLFSQEEYVLLGKVCRKRKDYFAAVHSDRFLIHRKDPERKIGREEIIRDLQAAEEARILLLERMIRLQNRTI